MDESARELVRDWLTRASHDLRAARILAAVDNPLLDSAIYHCQQFMLETIGFTWNAEATDLKWREMLAASRSTMQSMGTPMSLAAGRMISNLLRG